VLLVASWSDVTLLSTEVTSVLVSDIASPYVKKSVAVAISTDDIAPSSVFLGELMLSSEVETVSAGGG
jgi:hypothetical protein